MVQERPPASSCALQLLPFHLHSGGPFAKLSGWTGLPVCYSTVCVHVCGSVYVCACVYMRACVCLCVHVCMCSSCVWVYLCVFCPWWVVRPEHRHLCLNINRFPFFHCNSKLKWLSWLGYWKLWLQQSDFGKEHSDICYFNGRRILNWNCLCKSRTYYKGRSIALGIKNTDNYY